jgi:hypothetical protein
MRVFKDNAPLRLVLPWEPPVRYEDPMRWAATLADNLDYAALRDVIGHFNLYEIKGTEIHFYMHPAKRPLELKKLMRNDKTWRRFMETYPDAKIEWAEDVLGDKR